MSTLFACCDRRGVIEFHRQVPDGLLELASGRPSQVYRLINATARHAYDGKTLLVPGIPEAEGDDEALNAAVAFRDWIGGRAQ